MSDAKDKIFFFFEGAIFPCKDSTFKIKEEEKSEEESEEELEENKIFKYIESESKGINYNLFKDYFDSVGPTVLAKELFETKNKNKNSEFVKLIKVKWSNLKDKIEKMSEDEKKY